MARNTNIAAVDDSFATPDATLADEMLEDEEELEPIEEYVDADN